MIKRTIYRSLRDHLQSDQMTVLIGPRQVGKTYLMNLLRNDLENKGQKTLWLNLDNEQDKDRCTSQATLISYIQLALGKHKGYVFIDEIQRKENAGLFLKGIYDMHLPYKFIISGSGSLELKANIPESMAGRKQLFTINPVRFDEFVNYKTEYAYEDRLQQFFSIEVERMMQLLSEYMVFGGYPRVILSETVTDKQVQMQEIYRSYIDRDINDFLHLSKVNEFSDLLKIIASQIGGLVTLSELSSTVRIDEKTVRNYLYYLEKTFVLNKITPFYRNARKEISKAPMYYFIDIGLRNWLLGLFGLPDIPQPLAGHIFENVIYTLLRQHTAFTATTIHFWRTRDQAEVDFVLKSGLNIIPIEVKYAVIKKPEISRSYRNFLEKYRPKIGYIIHIGDTFSKEIDGTTIHFLSYRNILSERFNYSVNSNI